jgi:hypothetical protein
MWWLGFGGRLVGGQGWADREWRMGIGEWWMGGGGIDNRRVGRRWVGWLGVGVVCSEGMGGSWLGVGCRVGGGEL